MLSLLPHTILNSSETHPDGEAFRFNDHSISYQDLVHQSNRLANLLLDRGIKRGETVGIYLGRCLETAVAVYGIMQAGGAYVPLAPSAPPGYTETLIRSCNIKILITNPSRQGTLSEIIKSCNLNLVIGVSGEWPVDVEPWERLADYPLLGPSVQLNENDLAYIIFTSGSTGLPKGIMHTHYSGLNYARFSAALYGLKPGDRLGSHAPLHFDISTLAYFTAPLVGATSVIIPEAHTKMPSSMAQLVQTERLTVWYSAPLALVQMLTHGALKKRDMSTLRWVLFGGEPFPPKYLRELMQLLPQARFCNVYGPAEVNQCTYYHLPSPPGDSDHIPLGKVWNNTQMVILDAADRPVPRGEPGELLISSPTMMKGYWNQPELTRSSLFSQITNGQERIYYRTGDLVKIDENDNLLFLGRKDRQIKTRGYRVELEMVEAQLLALEEISEVAVFPVNNGYDGRLIEAAVILKTDANITREDIVRKLKTRLPDYAVPRKIHLLPELPRTSTGKIDHPRLRQIMIKVNE